MDLAHTVGRLCQVWAPQGQRQCLWAHGYVDHVIWDQALDRAFCVLLTSWAWSKLIGPEEEVRVIHSRPEDQIHTLCVSYKHRALEKFA